MAVAAVWRLGMLPMEIFFAVTVLFLLVWILTGVLLLWRDKRKAKTIYFRQFIAIILAVVVVAGCYFVTSAASKVHETVKTITQPSVTTSTMAVYVLAEDPAQTLGDAGGYTFAITAFFGAERTRQAEETIQKELGREISTVVCEYPSEMVDALYAKEAGAMIMDEAYAGILEDSEAYADFASRTRILYEAIIVQEQPKNDGDNGIPGNPQQNQPAVERPSNAEIVITPFVVYVSGSDTRSSVLTTSRSDVNILVVVNPQTKQVLLLNTPRDYYVPNPAGNGALDKLTHCGVYGINCSMQALAGLYDVPVDYYVQINFTGFETLIDAIGGVNVYSDTTFTSGGYSFQQGYNQMNGKQALVFARDRYSFVSGDNARGQHQMQVIKAVIQKMASGTIITNYSSILDSLQGMFITNLTSEEIALLVKMQISDMAQWNVVSYAVTGFNGSEKTYSMPGAYAYVMYPDQKTVDYASQLIDRVLAGETLTDADMTLSS